MRLPVEVAGWVGSTMIIALFFLSGATALVGQVVWMRMLGLALGNTVWAAAAVVAVWMAGMAVGARLGGWLAPATKHHLRWYGVAEALVGVFFALSPELHGLLLRAGTALGPDLGGALALGVAERLALAAVALALPTVLMGLTLPLLVERLRGTLLAGRVSLLYGVNTLGAMTGVFVAAYAGLPLMGEKGTLAAAGLVCGVVAVAAVVLEGRIGSPEGSAPSQARDGARPSFLLLAATMGAAALAAELVWVRILVLHLGSRVYAFAALLGVYLLGISLGSLVLWRLSALIRDPRRTLAAVQLGVAVALTGQVLALGYAGELLMLPPRLVTLPATFAAVQGVVLVIVACLFLPVTLLFGASFPLAVAADPGSSSPGAHAGAVSAANTAGGIVGALAAPFLLVPAVGCQRSLLLLALTHLAVAFGLKRDRRLLTWFAVGAALIGVVSVALPGDWVVRRAGEKGGDRVELVDLQESLSATVLVKRYHDAAGTWLSLELNGVNVAGSDPSLLAVQQLQGHLPLLQVDRPRRVLHVGFGSGGTCWAVARHPVERIDVVEIAPEVLEAADRYFAPINHHVLGDPRLEVIVNDGRNFLLATRSSYDAILSDSIHPVYAGNSTLYTLEYFRMCRDRLEPGGTVSMWLPLYSLDRGSYLRILSAFAAVFPRTSVWYDVTTVNEYTIVTGQVEPGPVTIRWDRLAEPEVARSLAIAGVNAPFDLAADLLLGPEEVAALVADIPPHDDDLPYVEYTSGRLFARTQTWLDNLRMLAVARSRSSPFAAAPVDWEAVAAYRDQRLRVIVGSVERLATAGDGG